MGGEGSLFGIMTVTFWIGLAVVIGAFLILGFI